jgi:hypothetical protein
VFYGSTWKISRSLGGNEPRQQVLVDVVDTDADFLHPHAQPFQQVDDPGR